MTRCACGYFRDVHDASGRCPLCACGKLPAEHLAVAITPSPRVTHANEGEPITWDGKQWLVCPGKPRTATGALPTLRRGEFKLPAPPEHRRDWFGLSVPVIEPAVAAETPMPLVPARFTIDEAEIAPGALRMGHKAAGAGWDVDPWYWVAGDGTEASAIVMRRGELRAYATWERPRGGSWKARDGYGWRAGERPVKVGVMALGKLLIGVLSSV